MISGHVTLASRSKMLALKEKRRIASERSCKEDQEDRDRHGDQAATSNDVASASASASAPAYLERYIKEEKDIMKSFGVYSFLALLACLFLQTASAQTLDGPSGPEFALMGCQLFDACNDPLENYVLNPIGDFFQDVGNGIGE